MLQPIQYVHPNSEEVWSPKKSLASFWEQGGKDIAEELVSSFITELEGALDSVNSELQGHVTEITRTISQAAAHYEQFKYENRMDEDFVK